NNQDGKRPASMVVQLYADNVPMPGKSVVLSDANKWTYTWSDLPKYSTAEKEVAYSAHVTSTLVDYTAATTEMTIEMTYVPSSTTISAFATWEDGEEVDGLRPETLTVELYADGAPTGNSQESAGDTGWPGPGGNDPTYKCAPPQ
ncbi:Cna B-type domain-containing protein, partial [Collinsella aerofaciens]|uniref:Cna B-type domain-containing protein n=1 Tax=Collinsella aerofaciens TaxID=74426 RepID=UPI00290F7E15